jgi:hypothetical protein
MSRITRTAKLGVAAAAATLAMAASVGACSASGTPVAAASPVQTNYLDVSWAESYHTVAALKAHSDLAVEVKVTKVLDQTTADGNIPYTDFQITVESVLYDPAHRVHAASSMQPATLALHQTGGTLNGQKLMVEDDPLFTTGEQCVLFLREYSPGHYLVVGGPTGRFTVTAAGMLVPIVKDGVTFSGQVSAMQAAIAKG